MKRFFFLFCIIVILSFFSGNSGLSLDNLPADLSKNNFNIILITIDALRPDHLSCYGYERKTSPTIDKIAEKGMIFKNAIAPSSWTVPSMVSLLTSVYPINHGVVHGIAFKKEKKIYQQDVFSDELTTLPKILKAHGYTTFGVASNNNLSEKFGFTKGFDYFICLPCNHGHAVNNTLYLWEDEIKKSDKFFIWVHYIDPHHPYHARSPWIEQYTSKELTQKLNLIKKNLSMILPIIIKDPQALSHLKALYDSEINYVDYYLGELIQKYKLDKNTIIIITSDHGEEFLEHGLLGHGRNLYQEKLHIPLIVKLPNSSKKKTVNKYINLIDIMPSILHLLNINSPEQTLGESFWVKKMSLRREPSDYYFAEFGVRINLKAIMTPQWKYIYNYQDKTSQLYNLKSDPLEFNNLVDKENKRCKQLREKLFEWVSTSKKYPTKKQYLQLSPEEEEKLKSLGYIK